MLLASLPKAASYPRPFLLFRKLIIAEACKFRLHLSDLPSYSFFVPHPATASLPPALPSPQHALALSPSVASCHFEDGARLLSTSSFTLLYLSEVLPENLRFL